MLRYIVKAESEHKVRYPFNIEGSKYDIQRVFLTRIAENADVYQAISEEGAMNHAKKIEDWLNTHAEPEDIVKCSVIPVEVIIKNY
ncbi:hypothetical protein [Peribacillus sp. FSL R5-0717]|uniref:hypothetical protein n=1 Tax=Peribacillus sp. FSL R5-0717 TaxID=2975308 RepID=UPI0030F6A4C8